MAMPDATDRKNALLMLDHVYELGAAVGMRVFFMRHCEQESVGYVF